MPYEFSEFERHLPTHHCSVIIDDENQVALHAGRWPYSAFDGLAEFVQFTYRYSSVLQPFLFDHERDDLEGWFAADSTADQRAADFLQRNPTKNEDARHWMARFYPQIKIDWLNMGVHGKLISLVDGARPEMIGYDAEGYFCVFAADAT